MLAFIARAICSKTLPALRRRRTSVAIVLYLATKGTVGLCRLWPSIRAGGRLAPRCTTRALLTASVLMPKAVATASQLSPPLLASSLEFLSNAMLGYVLAHIYTKRFFKKRNGCGLSIKRSTDMRGCINARFTLHLCVCTIYGFNPLDRCNILAEVF